jgi:hypothetical protein
LAHGLGARSPQHVIGAPRGHGRFKRAVVCQNGDQRLVAQHQAYIRLSLHCLNGSLDLKKVDADCAVVWMPLKAR